MRILTILFTVTFLVGCKNDIEKKELIRPVFYQEISQGSIAGTRTFSGISQAENEANLSFKVGGTLEKIHYKLGQVVKKGNVIAHVNNDDYEINYQKAASSRKNAQIQMDNAKSSFNRVENLFASNNASLSDFEKAKAQYESSKTMLRTAESQLKAARNQLNYTKLKAPFDGSISKIIAKENEMIGAGRPVLLFSSNGNVEIKAQVPENIIQSVTVGLEAKISFTSMPNKVFIGEIYEIGKSTSGTSTFPLTIRLSNNNDEILPGMACKIELTFDENQNDEKFIIISTDAVSHDEGGDFVYILSESDEENYYIAKRKNITLGELKSNGYEVKDGLNHGEKIITAGLSFMYDGRKVRLLDN